MILRKIASETMPEPAPDYTLGERICHARDSAGLSTAQLARRLGIKTVTLQGWESDRSEPRSNKLVMLAGVLNVSPTWLLVGRGTPPYSEPPPENSDTMKQSLNRVHAQALALVEEIERLKLALDD